MTKENPIKVKCTVIEPLPNTVFLVKQEDGHLVLARACRKMMKHFIRILPGDCVVVELLPDDLNRGRMISRC